MSAHPKSSKAWTVPPLNRATTERKAIGEDNWSPPELPASSLDTKQVWVPPTPPISSSDPQVLGKNAVHFLKIHYWRIAILILGIVIIANHEKIPGLWAETFYRKPSQKWIKAIASEKMPSAFANGEKLAFEIGQIRAVRETPGFVTITVTGKAITREAFYEAISFPDPLLEIENKLQELRLAENRAHELQERAAVEVKAFDENAFQFVKEITSAGQMAPFEFQFQARRNGADWQMEKIVAATITPAGALLGKPIASFANSTSGPSILGTEKAKKDILELTAQIDRYVASVSEAGKVAVKRFAAEGRDASGNYLFPQNGPMPGERFPETRMHVLQSDELQTWPDENLQYAINEIFARHGAKFGDKRLNAWFRQFTWYRPQSKLSFDQVEGSLPDIESQNIKTLGYARTVNRENALAQQQAIAAQQAMLQAQQQQAEAEQRAQQEAIIRAQQDEAARQMVGGILQSIANSIPRR